MATPRSLPPSSTASSVAPEPAPSASSMERARAWLVRMGATRARLQWLGLLVVLTGVVVHNLQLSHWYIEDAAIDFAYAKHLVNGDGFVPTPGGEVIEGYSNPTWLAVLVLFRALGFDLFATTHWIGLALSVLTALAVWFGAREMAGKDSEIPLLATAFLAASSQFAVWGTAGLENPLWNLIMALGLWRMAVELREDERDRFRFPWSSVCWLLLSLTRPEGILYAALAGFFHMCWTVARKRSVLPTVLWLVTFFVPWTAYQVWHYETFAWPFPNTFYAKVDRKDQAPFSWNKRPWNWTRNFFLDTAQGFFLPVWVLGILGHERWRLTAATVAFATIGLFVELSNDQRWLLPVIVGVLWAIFWLGLRRTEERPPRWLVGVGTLVGLALVGGSEWLRSRGMTPHPIPVPQLLKDAPPYVLVVCAVLFPIVGVGARGWSGRVPAWLFCCAAVAFAVYSQGDWMRGYRWYAMASVPGSLLFAWGATSAGGVVQQMFGQDREREGSRLGPLGLAVAVGLVLLQLPANVTETAAIAAGPDPAPRGIVPRIEYVRQVTDRLHYDEPIGDADVDMGAHLYWTDFHMLDIAGLVDIPFAHQRFERPFVREYLFEEQKPIYIHIHGGWAGTSHIPTHPEFRSDYFEIPGFPAGKMFHIGNYVRRDAVVHDAWPHGTDRVAMEDGIVLYPPWVPAEPGAGKQFYVEVGMQDTTPKTQRKKDDDFRLLLFASDGSTLHTWELPPGWDWLWPHEWETDEVFQGKFDLPVADLEPGTYDLGYVLTREDGTVVAPLQDQGALPPGAVIGGRDGADAVLAVGEVRFPGALRVLTVEERGALCTEQYERVLSESKAGHCEAAEEAWSMARWHRAGEKDWARQHKEKVGEALSECWSTSSDAYADTDRDEQIRRLLRAHRWEWRPEAYTSRAVPLAARLEQEGLQARDQKDWETAYRLFSDAVALDGTRTFSRRYAEEARAWRLGIDPDSLAKRDAEEAARQAEVQARRTSLTARQHRGVRLPTSEAAPPEPTTPDPATPEEEKDE